ncbi:type I methionyl aminopeptidase [Cellulosilyticum sp. ST5]|uniref:Methionine aminopeptidase n=1 Tax=Cellulosilyticum lentocellum (strain ATCC 49066 / DSM 5427 / NCIMB 11756 / RHM5) TaxID=642492 RepID=F2JSH0_CELLD|nr:MULTISPECIES: type I methionyl aminopeptidase [Cellulosilyticum]ADZ85208.1 methionine aminopeptidase, type I [Cellulosilyticum lentocellum DSM 5427]QEH70766.1 type I methionyl aminopeptidase [Cellulosilyticum sp. WCF-2]
MAIHIKSADEISLMREAAQILVEAHDLVAAHIKEGITTKELDSIAEKFIKSKDAYPSFLNYHGYPGSACISINDEVVHGIPGKRKLQEGDIVSVDLGVYYKGYHSDAARTYPVGTVDAAKLDLIRVTKESFFEGLKYAKPGNHLSDISSAIQRHAEAHGYGVVRDLVGHGIGKQLHEEPQVPNYKTPGRGPKLQKGMVLAIEPMINMGTWQVRVLEDDWTFVTRDGSVSAHYENTVVITDDIPEILTIGK